MSDFEELFSPAFENVLLGHLDSRTASGNKDYCDMMSVDYRYFQPSPGARVMSSDELKDLAFETARDRRLKSIEAFNRSVQNACFTAVRQEIIST